MDVLLRVRVRVRAEAPTSWEPAAGGLPLPDLVDAVGELVADEA